MLGLSLASPSNTTLFTSSKPISGNPKSSIHGFPSIKNVSFLRMPSPSSLFSSSSSSSSPSSSVVMMAKRQEELTEIRAKTTEEINDEIIDLQGELFMLRLLKSAKKEFVSSEFRRMRKRIARMLTIRRERELEQGIKKRLSRKLDKQWKRSIVVRPAPSLKRMIEAKAAEDAEKAKKAST